MIALGLSIYLESRKKKILFYCWTAEDLSPFEKTASGCSGGQCCPCM